MRNGSRTFAVTVLHGIRVGSWKTKPMRPGARSVASRHSPALGAVRPATMRSSVLLPQPEGPSRLRNSPGLTSRSMPASASRPAAKRFATPRSSRIGSSDATDSGFHPDFLVDELQRVRLFVIHVGGVEPGLRHGVEKVHPAGIGHRADAERLGLTAVDDAVFLDLADPVGDQLVVHLRIVF